MNIFFSPKCLEYRSPGHPESPKRVKLAGEYLQDKYTFQETKPATEEDILLVHTPEHLKRVEEGNFFDADTPNLPRMYEYALLSAGGAIQAAKQTQSISLNRPPGHHAGANFLGGFCYFNNLAIATAKALPEYGKIAILDIDGHHGNGTEDIFKESTEVMYVSLHQYPAYPGTGLSSSKNIRNFPLAPGADSPEYLKKYLQAVEGISEFQPGLIAISAGFDTYVKDPLLNLNLELGIYKEMGKAVKKLNLPYFAVLEGGYTADLGLLLHEFLQGLTL